MLDQSQKRWVNIELALFQRLVFARWDSIPLRRWADTDPALAQHLVFAGY